MADQPTIDLQFPTELGPHPEQAQLPTGVAVPERACLRCGQPLIAAYALANGYMAASAVYICTHSEQLLADARHAASPCYALVCPHCGYTELYTAYPQVLVRASP